MISIQVFFEIFPQAAPKNVNGKLDVGGVLVVAAAATTNELFWNLEISSVFKICCQQMSQDSCEAQGLKNIAYI